jgi:hypothetical protein
MSWLERPIEASSKLILTRRCVGLSSCAVVI